MSDLDWKRVKEEIEKNKNFDEFMDHTGNIIQEYAGKIDARIFANITYLDEKNKKPSKESYQTILDQTYNLAMLEAVINDDLNYAIDIIFQGEEQSIEIFSTLDESLGNTFQTLSTDIASEEALETLMHSICNYQESDRHRDYLNNTIARSMIEGVRPGELERVTEAYQEFNNHKHRLRETDRLAKGIADSKNIEYTLVEEKRSEFDENYENMYNIAKYFDKEL